VPTSSFRVLIVPYMPWFFYPFLAFARRLEYNVRMLNNEKNNRYGILLDPSLINQNGILKPQAYQALYCELAERHLSAHGVGSDKAGETGLAWVLVSMAIDIKNPGPPPGLLQAETWKSGRKGPYFLRDYIFYNSEGAECFRGTSHSVLFDLNARQVFRDRSHPMYALTADRGPLTSGTATWKQSYGNAAEDIAANFQIRSNRRVENSFLDMLGHVNNIRYAEFAYDAMTDAEIDSLVDLRRMEVYFSAELRKNDAFTVSAATHPTGLFFRGTKEEDGKTSFDLVLEIG